MQEKILNEIGKKAEEKVKGKNKTANTRQKNKQTNVSKPLKNTILSQISSECSLERIYASAGSYLPGGIRSGRGIMVRGVKESSIRRFNTLRNEPLSASRDIPEMSVRPFLFIDYMLCHVSLHQIV